MSETLWVVLANLEDCDQPEIFGVWHDHDAAVAFMDDLWSAELPGIEHVEVSAIMSTDIEAYRETLEELRES